MLLVLYHESSFGNGERLGINPEYFHAFHNHEMSDGHLASNYTDIYKIYEVRNVKRFFFVANEKRVRHDCL